MQELTGLDSKWATTLMAQHLLAAADRYGLDRLRLMCEASLCEDVAINTVATTLALAEQHHCFQLKAVCLKFIARPENLRGLLIELLYCHASTAKKKGATSGVGPYLGHSVCCYRSKVKFVAHIYACRSPLCSLQIELERKYAKGFICGCSCLKEIFLINIYFLNYN